MANNAALKAIQTAFYSTLHGDSTLLGLVTGGVHNDAPKGTEYPYILIGTPTLDEWHTMGGASVGRGWDTTVTVHIWSRYQGDLEALTILDRVVELLDFVTLTISGYGTVITRLDQVRGLITDVDKIETRHFPAVFSVMVHQ